MVATLAITFQAGFNVHKNGQMDKMLMYSEWSKKLPRKWEKLDSDGFLAILGHALLKHRHDTLQGAK
jgi:hypothetical protein